MELSGWSYSKRLRYLFFPLASLRLSVRESRHRLGKGSRRIRIGWSYSVLVMQMYICKPAGQRRP